MKLKIIIIGAFLLVMNNLFAQIAVAPSLGDGSPGSPFQIATWENLYWVSQNPDEWVKDFIQTSDINLGSAVPSIATWDGGGGWTPIGNNVKQFTGNYNGDGYIIDDLFCNRSGSQNQALFGYTLGAIIKNLGVTNANITGYQNVAALIGWNGSNSSVINCYSTGNISGLYLYAGGLISFNSGSISNSFSSASVTGNEYTGGLTGWSSGSSASISSCYSTGNVRGVSFVGGLVGHNWNSATISNCYSTGDVTRSSGTSTSFSAFAGYNVSSTIECCYSTGSVFQSDGVTWADGTKGFVGTSLTSTYTNNYFDSEVSNQSSGAGAEAKSTTEMKTASTFFDTGWSNTIWYMDAGYNNGYAYLSWQNTGGTPLPVELVLFSASLADGKVILNWETAMEVNNYGFSVERFSESPTNSEERIGDSLYNWVEIGFVQGHGNSNSPKQYEFVDNEPPADSIQYRLKQIDTDGSFTYYSETVGINNAVTGTDIDKQYPTEYVLYQNYPNPFNPTTKIKYSIPALTPSLSPWERVSDLSGEVQRTETGGRVRVTLLVYDILGREIITLVNEAQPPGNYEVEFDAKGLSSGIYFYTINVGKFKASGKMILLR